MKKKMILESIVVLLILLWAYAAFSKLFIYPLFQSQLVSHPLLMDYAGLVAWLVPAVEIVIALCLIIPRTQPVGLYASVTLLFLFTAYIIYTFLFYPHKPCSCGGIIGKLSWRWHILFNVIFMILAVMGIWLKRLRMVGSDRSSNNYQTARHAL
jgi:uncharacterized membrane protein YphA (DoxX/SURF4 family)